MRRDNEPAAAVGPTQKRPPIAGAELLGTIQEHSTPRIADGVEAVGDSSNLVGQHESHNPMSAPAQAVFKIVQERRLSRPMRPYDRATKAKFDEPGIEQIPGPTNGPVG